MSEPLTVSFATLHRGPIRREWRLEAPGDVLGSLPVELGDVHVSLALRGSPRDGVRARGTIDAMLECECRRCLSEIDLELRADVDIWFRTVAQVTPGEDGVWPFGANAGEIDLTAPIREELLLVIPPYPVCGEGCAGLCPSCGVRLADEECTCPPREAM